jgi:hypothetical protein
MEHRAEAQNISGITEAQLRGLKLGRRQGTNNRTGYSHRESSKRKCAASNRAYWAAHPEQAIARGTRGELHYKWKGGASKLNVSIRQMHEHRQWMDATKARDGKCACGSTENLESHHIVELADLIAQYGIKNREDARTCPELWDTDNGVTLCRRCHYAEHGRRHAD